MLAIIIVIMVVATLTEKVNGSTDIYSSWWFVAAWAVLAVSASIYIIKRKLFNRPVVLILHASFIVILLGAVTTHIFGVTGAIHLREGESTNRYADENNLVKEFPFTLTLEGFDVINYPGTDTPMDYVSKLSVSSKDFAQNNNEQISVSMNKIGNVKGFRLYQSSYDEDEQGSILAVSYDPWGIGITYTGYALLFISMLLLLVLPKEGFRKALKRLAIVLIALSPLCDQSAFAKKNEAPKAIPQDLAEQFCDLYGYYNGRICPLQTIAYDFTNKLYGKSSYQGLTAEQVFTGWYFFPTDWLKTKTKNRKGGEVEAVKQMLFNGQLTKIYPHDGQWLSQGDDLPKDMPNDEWYFIKKSLDYVGELVVTKQYDKLSETLGKIKKYQVKNAGDVLPSESLFKAEKVYNRYNYTKPLAMTLLTLFFVSIGLFIWAWLRAKDKVLSISRIVSSIVLCISTLYLLFLIILRWYVSGHLPLTNGFETMQFMSLCVMVLALCMQKKFTLIIPFGFMISGLTLLVSMIGQANPQITPLMPVLSSPLLSIHVCIIMIAYTLLAFMFLISICALVVGRISKTSESQLTQLLNISKVMLYPAIFCLAAGIFIGAIWANVSWGRYWGWDPKEVWALITLLVYSFALHTESIPAFRNPKVYHIFMALAFVTVLMTYFGVNFLLGGMHSYANA